MAPEVTATGVGGGHAVLGQAHDDVGQVRRRGVQHERAGRVGQRRPVDTPPHVRLDVRGAERDTRVGRHGRAGGDARDDVERQPGGGDGDGLGHHRVGGQRVAADQPHDRPARGRLGDQAGGHVGGLADGVPDLGAVGHEGEHALGDVGVGDHQRGAGDRVAGPDGEQPGVAGAAAHEGDASGGGRCAVHRSTPG